MSDVNRLSDKIRNLEFNSHPYRYDWKSLCDLDYIGCGGSRVIYRLDSNTVGKFAFNYDKNVKNGFEQNREEVNTYKRADINQKKHLGEIKGYKEDFSFIKMRYYDNILLNISKEKKKEVEQELDSVGITFNESIDSNVAEINGNYVIIDYGINTKL